jgi:hypothetical protein
LLGARCCGLNWKTLDLTLAYPPPWFVEGDGAAADVGIPPSFCIRPLKLVLRFTARCFPGGCPYRMHFFLSDPPL